MRKKSLVSGIKKVYRDLNDSIIAGEKVIMYLDVVKGEVFIRDYSACVNLNENSHIRMCGFYPKKRTDYLVSKESMNNIKKDAYFGLLAYYLDEIENIMEAKALKKVDEEDINLKDLSAIEKDYFYMFLNNVRERMSSFDNPSLKVCRDFYDYDCIFDLFRALTLEESEIMCEFLQEIISKEK